MAALPSIFASSPRTRSLPELSRLQDRERLSQSAMDGFFAIIDKWRVSIDAAAELLGGIPRSSLYKLKTAAGTLRHDELMRISFLVGIYQALQALLPEEMANQWMTRPNDHPLFLGRSPLEYAIRTGIPGLQQVRSFLDAASAGQ